MGKLVFVYGTLMRGEANHEVLGSARQVSAGVSVYNARLWSLGAYPAMTLDGSARDCVRGEIYEVDEETLARLDRLEGCPRLYQRTEINGVLAYTMTSHAVAKRCATRIMGGSWKGWR